MTERKSHSQINRLSLEDDEVLSDENEFTEEDRLELELFPCPEISEVFSISVKLCED